MLFKRNLLPSTSEPGGPRNLSEVTKWHTEALKQLDREKTLYRFGGFVLSTVGAFALSWLAVKGYEAPGAHEIGQGFVTIVGNGAECSGTIVGGGLGTAVTLLVTGIRARGTERLINARSYDLQVELSASPINPPTPPTRTP